MKRIGIIGRQVIFNLFVPEKGKCMIAHNLFLSAIG